MPDAPLVLLAAGGTGGHLFPAEALAVALKARGAEIELATDHRATQYVRVHRPIYQTKQYKMQ